MNFRLIFGYKTALIASYCGQLKECLESQFGERTNGSHTPKDASEDIQTLAYELFRTSSLKKEPGRKDSFIAPDIIAIGIQRLSQTQLDHFNNRFVYSRETTVLPNMDEETVTYVDVNVPPPGGFSMAIQAAED